MDGTTAREDALRQVRERHAALERAGMPETLGAFLDTTVERFRDRACWVSIEDRATLTYGELGDSVARCATMLRDKGVEAGDVVALMLPNTPAFAVTWLACARLGAAIVPLNTRYTAREIAYALKTAGAGLAVADEAFRAVLAGSGALPETRVVHHAAAGDSEWHRLVAASPPATRHGPADGDTLVNLQFTSGSTGSPKACMLPQRYWIVLALARAAQGPPIGRMLLDMPFHYMGGQWRFLMALWLGATAYVAPRPSLTGMVDRLIADDIDFCTVSPALAKADPDPRRDRLSLAWAGTMAMPKELLGPVRERLGGAPVCEMYGTTETGAIAATPVGIDWRPGTCGLAVPFRTVRIVGEDGADVPDGAPGELWVTGPGMMTGYYGNPEATRAAFHGAWFRTGDLFVRDGDGFLRMLGRIKDVIRRSGENISPFEIEAVLASLEEVEDVAAIPVPDPYRGEEVMVCLKLREGHEAGDALFGKVGARCRAELASFKRPRYVAVVSSIPKTESGKTAKKVLADGLDALVVAKVDTEPAAARGGALSGG